MRNTIVVFYLMVVFVLASCAKSDNLSATVLQGKWELSETYNGYLNGGDFLWQNVAFENRHTIEMLVNGTLILKRNANGNNALCSGSYTVVDEVIVMFRSQCNAEVEKLKIMHLSSGSLVLERSVREGVIRYKYFRVN